MTSHPKGEAMNEVEEMVRPHPYEVVGEMLEFFDSHSLATWAPLASIIERERKEARNRALDEALALVEQEKRDFADPAYAGGPIGAFGERFACDQIAERIRSLREKNDAP